MTRRRPKLCLDVSVDPRRLLLLREVARGGSMAAAARALGATQQAVSQQIARLEGEVGVPLVVRQGRGTALTEAGVVLVGHADAVADRLAAARQDVAALTGLVAGTVRVVAFPTAAAIVLPPALAALRKRAPAVVVRFTELEPPEAEQAVRNGDAELGVVFRHVGDERPPPGDLICEPLTHDAVQLVVPADSGDVSGLAELRDAAWIAGCARCRQHLLRCTAGAGFSPDVRFATDDHVVVQRLVAEGLGVALLPRWALRASRHGGVRAVDVAGVDERIIELVLRPETRRTPAVAALLDAVRATGRSLDTDNDDA